METGIPEFHTFREMCEHIGKGGAAYRYGSTYPIYYMGGFSIERRIWGGSAGECTDGMLTGVSFSTDEQNSKNWVLVSPDDWRRREDDKRKRYETMQHLAKTN